MGSLQQLAILLNYLLLFTVHTLSQSTYEAPKIQVVFEGIADKDYQNETIAVFTNANPVFELDCSANYPIEWILHYSADDDGISEHRKIAYTYREVEKFEDPSTYTYRATLELEYKGKILSLTNFTCQETLPNNGFRRASHVVMSDSDMKRLIILKITSLPPLMNTVEENHDCGGVTGVIYRPILTAHVPCVNCQREDGTMLELDFNSCDNPIECNSIYSRVSQNRDCVRDITHPHQPGVRGGLCKSTNVKSDVTVFGPKIVICKNYGTALRIFYFRGIRRGELENKNVSTPSVYYNWNDVNPKDMLYFHPSEDNLYVNQNITFVCEYSRYYYSIGSWFGVWDERKKKMNYIQSEDIEPVPGELWRGTYMANTTTSFASEGRYKIYCLGPVWNTSEWVNDSLTVTVQQGMAPSVYTIEADSNGRFVVGQQHRKLICKFGGQPVPSVSWISSNNESKFRVLTVDTYTSAIDFPEVGYQTSGVYTCIVKSFQGEAFKTYKIDSSAFSSSVIAVITVATVLGLVCLFLCFWRQHSIIRKQAQKLRDLTEAEVDEFLTGNPELLQSWSGHYFDKSSAIDALPYDKQYEIPPENIELDESHTLGSGEYGIVVKGTIKMNSLNEPTPVNYYVNANHTTGSIEVAVKICKGKLDVTSFKALLSEIKVLTYLGFHTNVVGLIGASTKNIRSREFLICVEYCLNGSMDKYLRNNKNMFQMTMQPSKTELTLWNLNNWTGQIADGLEFVHSKKIIHADIAIRNILLTDKLTAKVCDFGLSRQLADSSSYTKTTKCPLPWRNMALESFQRLEFSVKTDVWSFGVAIWEIFTFGDVPYPGLTFTLEFPSLLEKGLRLYKPPLATNEMYEYMLQCWNNEPTDRPRVVDVKEVINKSKECNRVSYAGSAVTRFSCQ